MSNAVFQVGANAGANQTIAFGITSAKAEDLGQDGVEAVALTEAEGSWNGFEMTAATGVVLLESDKRYDVVVKAAATAASSCCTVS